MKNPLLSWSLLIILALIWGSSFILMKKGMLAFDSHQVAALRIFVAFLFLLPFGFIHFRKQFLHKWKAFLAVGLFGNFIPAFLFTLAETGISSSLAGLLNSLTPIFTLILGALLFRMNVRWVQVAGIILGFLGAAVLIIGSGTTKNLEGAGFGLLVVIATLCYGLSVNVIRRYLQDVPSVTTSFFAFMMVGIPAGIYLFSTDFIQTLQTEPIAMASLGYTAILGVIGTATAVILFNILIKQTSALFASSVTYLIPIVALGWGIADGEEISMLHFLAILLILGGIFLINRQKKAKIEEKASGTCRK